MFSVPGADELRQSRPVAGDTGENMDIALKLLHERLPDFFKSIIRYDYRITNAFDKPIAVGLGDKMSEATKEEIESIKNVKRVLKDIQGCTHVI